VIDHVLMPTSDEEDDEVKRIYEELNDLIKTVKGEENLITLGDFNATVVKRKEKNMISKYGLGFKNPKG